MVLCSIERTCNTRGAAVDWCVGRGADIKFSELIELNVNLVLRASFTLGFHLLSLLKVSTADPDAKVSQLLHT